MADSGKPSEIPIEWYDRYKNDGFTDEEINQIWKDRATMIALYTNRKENEPREITSAAYKQSQKRLNKHVNDWFF